MKKIMTETRQHFVEEAALQAIFPKSIEQFAEIHDFEAGEFINVEGDEPAYLYYILSGKVKVYFTQSNGKVALLHFLGTHSFIGDMELLEARYYSKGIQASQKTRCLAFPTVHVRELLLNDVTFLRHLALYMSKKIMHNSAKMSQSLAYPLENRLAEFILMSENNGIYKEKHTEAAEFLGVSYRHLLHVLAQFVERGLLQKDGRCYILRQKSILEEMATSIFATAIHD